ncbi:molybdopterin-containing oxidoreductase family protein [Sedimenticola hydrogenitrophicus]|uniref:molybdopterin-containing oxidoreductase family protein n=1 Tax=Sedimenticola hydrogenitrophicus TaxID=2967975 RepID=UPI0023B1CAF6|nr:molybdopterin-dependent oxidoreductase [Sedimenticola hydrogenitrophicus]
MINRRKFLLSATAAISAPLLPAAAESAEKSPPMTEGGVEYSTFSGAELEAVPGICGECPSHCAIIGYSDEGQLVKVEGNPSSIRNLGRICSKGQAGMTKVYDPDRLLQPMHRTGKRGEGKWQTISWEAAIEQIRERLARLRDQGKPERFLFQHGWISSSAEKLIGGIFMPAFGSASILDQRCNSLSARRVAQQLTWGGALDSPDLERARLVVNFGSNLLEADTNMVALARRLTLSQVDRRMKMVTFDVRLSNTAAKSDQWVPVKPGTDLAVILAMCHQLVADEGYRGAGERFLEFCQVSEQATATVEEKIAHLRAHLESYTPEWAQQVSGVDAELIRRLSAEIVDSGPTCFLSSRGATARYNGVETERALMLLAALSGNINNPGGRSEAVLPEWQFPQGPEDRQPARRLGFLGNEERGARLQMFDAGDNVLKRIKEVGERPELYLWYHHNPLFANADTGAMRKIMKDESLLPFTVAVSSVYDESAALADLILPDTTPLECFGIELGISPNRIAEYSLRQPMVAPQGEARDFVDVCCELGEKLGLNIGFSSHEAFVEAACKETPVVKRKARGFRGLTKSGVWHDKKLQPQFNAHQVEVPGDLLQGETVLFDEVTGVYWDWRLAGVTDPAAAERQGYSGTAGAGRGYLGQRIGDKVYRGFAPGQLDKSGYLELYSPILAAAGLPGLPSYQAIPSHQQLEPGQFMLSTFKVNVQTSSATGNAAWLSEIHHDSEVWINPLSAAEQGVTEGSRISLRSAVGEVEAVARLTQGIMPGAIAISIHSGRWEGGRYASDQRTPQAIDDRHHDAYKWWQGVGVHPNDLIADSTEPVAGQQCWMDTVVSLSAKSG